MRDPDATYRRQARTRSARHPRADARAVRRASAARSRSSSSSATTRGGSTTTSASSATARSRAGRCRRASRSSRASARSPSTSRTTRSTTPTSRARSRKGEYGAGTVEIWDRGTYELVEEKRDGGLTVRLHGERLEGIWTLVPAKLDGDPKNWLILRKRDDSAPTGERAPAPVQADARHARRRSCRSGEAWLFEVKWDGYRAIAYVRGGEAELRSRNDNDLTRALPGRREGARGRCADARLRARRRGLRARRGRAGRRFSAMQQGKPGRRYVYYAFDVLEVDGEPLVDLPLARAAGAARAAARPPRTATSSSPRRSTTARRCRGGAGSSGCEGIIAKRADSRYRPGQRTRDWLKIKTHGRQEFVIAGYTKGQGRRAGRFGSLVLGRAARRRAALRRQRRHRLHRRGDRAAAASC